MSTITSLFVMSLIAAPNAWGYVTYKSNSKAYRIEKTKKALVLHEGGLDLALPFQDCSKQVTDSLMSDIAKNAAQILTKEGRTQRQITAEIEFGDKALAAANTQDEDLNPGNYFHNLPGHFAISFVKAKANCKNLTLPNN